MRPAHLSLALLLALPLAAVACGKRGSPSPPEPRGPLAPSRVEARQIGSRVVVGFVAPAPRGEKPSQQPVRAELVRVDYPPGVEVPADPDAFRRRGQRVGVLEARPLPSGRRLTLLDTTLKTLPDEGRGHTLRYGVRVLDLRGRPSPLVLAEELVPRPAVGAPQALSAEPTADGIRLLWRPPQQGEQWRFNLYRERVDEDPTGRPLNAEPLAVTEYLDEEVEIGARYRYYVRVTLSDERPFREGETSRVVELTAEDRFAPAAPAGLVAVQEAGAVRLFWDPSAERDVAGYRVYRRSNAESWERVGPDRVEQPLWLDREVTLDAVFDYRVTAIDRADPPNESEPSEAVQIQIVPEPESSP